VRVLAAGEGDEALRLRQELTAFAGRLRDEATAKGERLRARHAGTGLGFTVR
jgi:5-(carboxyamino)imidazole ribonucleotide mutase